MVFIEVNYNVGLLLNIIGAKSGVAVPRAWSATPDYILVHGTNATHLSLWASGYALY